MRILLTVIVTAAALAVPAAPAFADSVTSTIDLINSYRAQHGVAPLAVDPDVTSTAQDWADHLEQTDTFEHRSDNPYGESLYWVSSRTREVGSVAEKAVQSWYAESSGYDYSREMTEDDVDHSVLHFTAMVWKSSDRAGVGLAQGRNGTYVVVDFAPRGNTLHHFVENVLPPSS